MKRRIVRLTGITLALALAAGVAPVQPPRADAQSATGHPDWPGKGDLFVGADYQPIDRSPEQIRQDIAIMKSAGFNIVRMGDLSWDSFEPENGRFTFEWFDNVLAQMHAAGIRVILDVPGEPVRERRVGVHRVIEHGAPRFGYEIVSSPFMVTCWTQ